ncbi:MAG: prolipoprotein diacylglyceryl transferase [Lachnospiraceae bacterium]|nr:prolipoprotein diacylglyceryl transferase [Lachnospiraceae bacterium]
MDIAFPNLGIYLRNMPKSFTVFGFEIALYGVIIGIGVIAGILMAARQAKVTGQDPDLYWDFSIYAVILSVVGARIYYVIFEWDMYKDNLLKIFNIREGGLAIYGGVIAGFSTLFVYAALKKQKAFRMADTAVTGLILGQAIGRWGNFTNREVFGEYTDNLLAMRLPVAAVRERDISESILAHMGEGINYIQVHPTFLYESLWNLGVLVLMLFYWKHKKFDGEIALLYLGGYGLGRAWIEGIRTDQLFIPGTVYPVSQVLAILLFAGAVLCDLIVRRRKKKSPA